MRRETEVAKLTGLLRDERPGLKLAAITGPGGVGKSYLLEEVFSRENPRDLEFMHLAIDGSNPQSRGDFMALIDSQLAIRALPSPARPDADYFPQVREVATAHRDIIKDSQQELVRSGVPEDVCNAVMALLRAGHVLNEAIKPTKEILDISKLELDEEKVRALLDAAWGVVQSLRSLEHTAGLWGPVRDLLGITLRNRVKQDLYNLTADALLGDITAALVGYRKKDLFKNTQDKLEGFSRLLIVLDDFEAIAPVLSDFVISSLLPRLAVASFPVVVLIACRDDLDAIHPGFAQNAKRWLKEDIRLKSFDRETALALMTEAGVPEAKQSRLFDMTHGFPYLLSLVIEQEMAPEGGSALFAKKFFDRTARWMTDRERGWFTQLCYLDVVNVNTIEAMMDEVVEPTLVQDWFEREASIRDPAAKVFTIRPLVREKCLQYFATRAPKRHGEMLERAKQINSASFGISTPGG